MPGRGHTYKPKPLPTRMMRPSPAGPTCGKHSASAEITRRCQGSMSPFFGYVLHAGARARARRAHAGSMRVGGERKMVGDATARARTPPAVLRLAVPAKAGSLQ